MRRPDDDLIASLAEGSLDPAAAAEAEAHARAHPEAAADLAAQRAALGALAGMEAATLDDRERAALRSSVMAAIGLDEVATAPRPRSRIPWPAMAASAAALVALFAITPLVGMLSTRGGDDLGITAVPAREALRGDAAEYSEDDFGDPLGSRSGGVAEGLDSTDTASSPPGTVVVEPPPVEDHTATTTGTTTTEAFEDMLLAALEAELEQDDERLLADHETPCGTEATSALEEADEGPDIHYAELHVAESHVVLVFFTLDADGRVDHLAAFDPDSCKQVESR